MELRQFMWNLHIDNNLEIGTMITSHLAILDGPMDRIWLFTASEVQRLNQIKDMLEPPKFERFGYKEQKKLQAYGMRIRIYFYSEREVHK